MRKYYNVTAAEIEHAATRKCSYGCMIAIREEWESPDGKIKRPMFSYGHPVAYKYVQQDGLTYAVSTYDDPSDYMLIPHNS